MPRYDLPHPLLNPHKIEHKNFKNVLAYRLDPYLYYDDDEIEINKYGYGTYNGDKFPYIAPLDEYDNFITQLKRPLKSLYVLVDGERRKKCDCCQTVIRHRKGDKKIFDYLNRPYCVTCNKSSLSEKQQRQK